MNSFNLQDPKLRAQLRELIRSGKIATLDEQQLQLLYREIEAYERAMKVEAAQKSLIPFCQWMMPEFQVGMHHHMMAERMEALERRDILRLAISLPPRHSKSIVGSELFPSWYLGHHPNHKVMGASHTGDLAEGFGRKVRNHIDSRDYQQIFPGTKLSKDSTAAGRWSTSAGGEAFYAGVGAALAGKGGDLVVVDDPHNEQDIIAGTDTPFDKAYTWFLAGPRQRLQANAVILILHTRWSKRDIIGRVLEDGAKNADADQYEYLELPMELPSGAPLWPEMWTLEAIKKLKASLLPHLWAAQYQQRPIGLGKTFINESDFKRWTRKEPPLCDYIILSLDAAVEKTTRSDYNVFQTWGVFTDEHIRDPDTQEKMPQIILLDVVRERLEFPELKTRAREILKTYQPDLFIIEKKANGAPLIQEFRRSGIPVTAYEPGALDKVARLNAVVDIIKSGLVWLPEFAWADQFIEEVCGFPNEAHDDQVDCCVGQTRVLMADGTEKRLDVVQVGDWVATPAGPCEVILCINNGIRDVFDVCINDKILTMTDNHPVATTEGWCTSCELPTKYAIVKASISEHTSWVKHVRDSWPFAAMLKWQSLMGGDIAGILTQKIRRTVGILAVLVASCTEMCGNFTTAKFLKATTYTEMCGNFTTAKFLKATTYTTKMGIAATIGSKIWSVVSVLCMMRNTAPIVVMPGDQKNNYSIWPVSATRQKPGMRPPKDGLGTDNTLYKSWLQAINHSLIKISPFAKLYARSAVKRLGLNIKKHSTAVHVALVESVVPAGKQHVYNLTVAGEHCYFANGVLVHNCLSQTLHYFRKGGFIALPFDPKDEDDNRWYKKPKYYGCR